MDWIKDLEERDFALREWHNTSLLTLSWFIIATSWIIISMNDIPIYIKYMFLISILWLVIWFLLSLDYTEVETKKLSKSACFLSKLETEKSTDIKKEIDELNKIREKKRYETPLKIWYLIFQNIWALTFIIWIIFFMISL